MTRAPEHILTHHDALSAHARSHRRTWASAARQEDQHPRELTIIAWGQLLYFPKLPAVFTPCPVTCCRTPPHILPPARQAHTTEQQHLAGEKNVRDQMTVSILHNLLPTTHPESCWTRCHQAPLHCRPYYGVVSVIPASQLLMVLLLPLPRGAVSGVAAAPAPLGVCATGSSVPLLLLVAIVLSTGCEDGLESIRTPVQTSKLCTRLKIFGRPGTKFWYPREPPINFHVCPTRGRCPESGHRPI